VLELEHTGVAVLHHHCGAGQGRELRQRVPEAAGQQARRQVGQRLALDGRQHPTVDLDGVVPCGQPTAVHPDRLLREAVGVPLVHVDEHRQLAQPLRAPAGRGHGRPGLLGRARGLPEDRLPPTPDPGEHELRPVLPPPVQHQVDRRSPPYAGAHGDPLDELGHLGPALRAVAVDLRRPGPRVTGLEHDAVAAQRYPDEVRQGGVRVRVARDDEVLRHQVSVPCRPGGEVHVVVGHTAEAPHVIQTPTCRQRPVRAGGAP
jgi:hypothetical protein